jgi:hypothetical protein
MVIRYLIISFSILISFISSGQIQHGGTPYSFQNEHRVTAKIDRVTMPKIDLPKLKQEDLVNDQFKDIPWRFGFNHTVDIDPSTHGTWEYTPSGKLWRVSLYCPDAKTVNILFDDFYLPEGSQLFLYNGDKSIVLGAFTHENNKPFRELGTSIVQGDQMIVEYFEPHYVTESFNLHISRVTHGYRGLHKAAKGLGSSGSCNNNVICPISAGWEDQIHSVALILVNGSGSCTGAMVNNTCDDETPYFLTANHCLGGSVSNWVFLFNWESPDCAQNLNGPTNQTVSGATLRANNSGSDMALLELSSPVPSSYNPFYAGWDNTGTQPTSQVAIHHPAGDIKKISFDTDPATSVSWSGAQTWEIGQWEDGTTEPGSSGSPLFDQNGRIVGQLYGGSASCTNISEDYYGRFDVSWDDQSASNAQLKFWLDKCNTGESTNDGFDPNAGPALNFDASLSGISGVESNYCNVDTISPTISVKNKGLNVINSLKIIYELSGVKDSTIWVGTINSGQTVLIQLPTMTMSNQGNQTLTVTTSELNGGSADQNANNNQKVYNFYAVFAGSLVVLELTLDDYPNETSWELADSLGQVIATGGPYANNLALQTVYDTLCLPNASCYEFRLMDSYGDGINSNPNAGYNIYSTLNPSLASTISINFGFLETNSFCTGGEALSIEEIETNNIMLFPNPNNGSFIINSSIFEQFSINIFDVGGSLVKQISTRAGQEINSDLDRGVYFIEIQTNVGRKVGVSKLIVSE